MDLEAVEKVYRRYAPAYDFCFGALFEPGRRAVIQQIDCRPGDRVLEVGVGTGLSLPLYPRTIRLTGVDVSREMLAKAQERTVRMKLDHVALHCMDAERMAFPDDSFDHVVAMYVVSVVPDPVRLIDEMRRVCRPGGHLYIVNHFRSTTPVVGAIERMIAPFADTMGFHPDLALSDFVARVRLDVEHTVPVNAFGYWKLVRARNNKDELVAADGARERANAAA